MRSRRSTWPWPAHSPVLGLKFSREGRPGLTIVAPLRRSRSPAPSCESRRQLFAPLPSAVLCSCRHARNDLLSVYFYASVFQVAIENTNRN